MAKTASRNLTTGSPTRLVIGFLLPLLGGLLFQQLYNMVDTLVVGRFLGMDALAGVGSTSSVNFLVLGFCIGICNGFVIPVAQKFGEGDEAELRRFVANSIWLSAAFAVVLTVATALLCTPVLRWMNTPDNIFRYAYDYIFVIFLGIPAIILYNLVSGVIRSLGDSRTPIYFLVLSSLLNVALDLLAVAVLGMGVEGPAWATVISRPSPACCVWPSWESAIPFCVFAPVSCVRAAHISRGCLPSACRWACSIPSPPSAPSSCRRP